jgi:hypothetical protein
MSDEGFENRRREGEERAQTRNLAEMERPLEGPGSEERLHAVRRRFRSSNGGDRLPTGQLILVAVAVFLIVLMFGAGRYVIAALAPKPPPGADAPP